MAAPPDHVTIVNHTGAPDPRVTGALDWSAEADAMPPPRPSAPAPASSKRSLPLPSAAERVSVPLLRVDDRFVYVDYNGEEKRFSRSTGFEVPPGGSWGSWRLAGKDHRRLKSRRPC